MTKEINNNTALLLIDIQNDYFPGGTMELFAPNEVAEKAKTVLSYFRDHAMPVVHIQHIAVQEGAGFFLPETKGAEIHESVQPLKNEKVIVKNFPNSFRETGLLNYLKEKSISNLVICGMMTDVCVSSTTRAATDFGFHNTVISDAVTTRDRHFEGKIISAQQITESFLAGLNALGGLYATIESSEIYLKKE